MKRDRLRIVAMVAACGVMLLRPPTAQAQITAPKEGAQIEYGPVSFYPTLSIADAGKDSNVFVDGNAPKDDYTFTVQSKLLAVTKLGLNELMVSAKSDYIWFQKYSQERSSNAAYAMRFNLSANRFKPFVGAFRSRMRSRPDPEIDARVVRVERQAQSGGSVNLTERTAITASALFSDISYEDGQFFKGADLSQELNRTGRTYSAGLRYTLTPLTTLIAAGQYTEDVFPKSHLRDARTYTLAPTLEFSPDAAIHGSVTAGYEVFKPNNPEFADYRGPTYQGMVNWLLFGTTTFDLRGGRSVGYSYRDTEPYYLQTGTSVAIAQRIFGPFELRAGGDREHLAYRWRVGVPGTVGGKPDVTDVYYGGVGIALARGIKVSINAERTNRRAGSDSLASYSRTRLLTTVLVGS